MAALVSFTVEVQISYLFYSYKFISCWSSSLCH